MCCAARCWLETGNMREMAAQNGAGLSLPTWVMRFSGAASGAGLDFGPVSKRRSGPKGCDCDHGTVARVLGQGHDGRPPACCGPRCSGLWLRVSPAVRVSLAPQCATERTAPDRDRSPAYVRVFDTWRFGHHVRAGDPFLPLASWPSRSPLFCNDVFAAFAAPEPFDRDLQPVDKAVDHGDDQKAKKG